MEPDSGRLAAFLANLGDSELRSLLKKKLAGGTGFAWWVADVSSFFRIKKTVYSLGPCEFLSGSRIQCILQARVSPCPDHKDSVASHWDVLSKFLLPGKNSVASHWWVGDVSSFFQVKRRKSALKKGRNFFLRSTGR